MYALLGAQASLTVKLNAFKLRDTMQAFSYQHLATSDQKPACNKHHEDHATAFTHSLMGIESFLKFKFYIVNIQRSLDGPFVCSFFHGKSTRNIGHRRCGEYH